MFEAINYKFNLCTVQMVVGRHHYVYLYEDRAQSISVLLWERRIRVYTIG